MDVDDWRIKHKPFDLRERLFDVRAKRQIVLRELKETSFRLRVLRQTGILVPAHDPVITECAELVKIVATLIRRSGPP
jgi:hypothetical protein